MSGIAPLSPSSASPSVGRILLVAARWNDAITRKMVAGAQEALAEAGIHSSCIDLVWVSGSFELPQVTQAAARSGRYDAIVPIGCIIRERRSITKFLQTRSRARSMRSAGRRSAGVARGSVGRYPGSGAGAGGRFQGKQGRGGGPGGAGAASCDPKGEPWRAEPARVSRHCRFSIPSISGGSGGPGAGTLPGQL